MEPLTKKVLKNPGYFLAFGLGAGLSPKAPGTAGTIVALPLIYWIHPLGFEAYFIITLLLTVFGTWLAGYASRGLGVHDHPGIVIDEIAGMMWVMAWFPVNIMTMLLGFALFRLFDIVKPFPIRWVDRHVEGGLGIMVDDLLAAVYSIVCLWLIVRFIANI